MNTSITSHHKEKPRFIDSREPRQRDSRRTRKTRKPQKPRLPRCLPDPTPRPLSLNSNWHISHTFHSTFRPTSESSQANARYHHFSLLYWYGASSLDSQIIIPIFFLMSLLIRSLMRRAIKHHVSTAARAAEH